MNEPVNDYYVTQMVQDLENERLRDGIEVIRDRCATLAKSAQTIGMGTLDHEMDVNAKALTGLLEGGIE